MGEVQASVIIDDWNFTMQTNLPNRPKQLSRVAMLAWIGTLSLLLAMFVGTHMPPALDSQVVYNDKLMHFWAYLALAFGFMTSCDLSLARLRPRHYFLVFVGCALYGAFDEITQIPVGRVADLQDWMFDIAGALAGVLLYRVLRPLVQRLVLLVPVAAR